ncbi:hypothetical protein [Nonomuraea dietziae]|uniref:hypothetical protein n=1 Tax=Nonomuraea dietziae TaxID=65515 RepID=UPI0031D36AF0
MLFPLVAFPTGSVLCYEPSVVAILGAGILVAATKVTIEQAIAEVELAHPGVLHGTVRHGRRPGRDRSDRRGVAPGGAGVAASRAETAPITRQEPADLGTLP